LSKILVELFKKNRRLICIKFIKILLRGSSILNSVIACI